MAKMFNLRPRPLYLAVLTTAVALFASAAPAPAYPPLARARSFPLAPGLDPVRAYSIAFGPDGELWFAGSGGDVGPTGLIGQSAGLVGHVSTDGKVVRVPIAGAPEGSMATSIAAGPDGAMWFTMSGANIIGRVTIDGTITQFPLAPRTGPEQIVTGPDGNLWFTEHDAGRIGRMTPSGEVTEFPFGSRSAPFGIAVGPDRSLWFTLSHSNRIGRLTPSGERSIFQLPKRTEPHSIVGTAAGLWFTEGSSEGKAGSNGLNKVGLLVTNGHLRQFTVPARFGTNAIAASSDGTVWFSTSRPLAAIESISPKGKVGGPLCLASECTAPPISLTVAPDGKTWFGTGTAECRICGGGSTIAQRYLPGEVGYLRPDFWHRQRQ